MQLTDGILETLTQRRNEMSEQLSAELIAKSESQCMLNTVDDDQVQKVIRAFWRRIYPYRNDYERELPNPMPVEFMSFMATALCWVDKPNIDHKAQRDELLEKLRFLVDNDSINDSSIDKEIQNLIAKCEKTS